MAEMTIRRFGVISVAKMYGFLLFAVGLIVGVLYGLFFIIFGAAMMAMTPGGKDMAAGGVSTLVIGIVMMITFPIMYGILGFISGIIVALIYNALAGIIGGVKFELEGVQQQDYVPPPPPHQWAPHQHPAQ